MTLRQKTLVILASAIGVLTVMLLIVASRVLSDGFSQLTVRYFMIFMFVAVLLFGAANLILLERTILARLSALSLDVRDIASLANPAARVQTYGSDELSQVGISINKMLQSLQLSQNELRESEAATRALLEGMPDSLFRIDAAGTVLDYKTARNRSSAPPTNLFVGNKVEDIFDPDMTQVLMSGIAKALEEQSAQIFEHNTLQDNTVVNNEVRVVPTSTHEVIAVVRDFTQRKLLEQTVKHYVMRDPLTGLYNRAYFQEKLTDLAESPAPQSVGIILCDIDGMRLINESLGREVGNNLLEMATNALRDAVPLGTLISRVGSDDFAVLLPGATPASLKITRENIWKAVDKLHQEDARLTFTLSIGEACGTLPVDDIQTIYRTAQASLHRDKLLRSQMTRKSIFAKFAKALETRDFSARQHAVRLNALMTPLAKVAGLSASRSRDLKLLAQFHDIGKVGTPDHVVFNEGLLSADDREETNLHPEIGYRIAQASPELSPIAEFILKHHEWWNGGGYPLGLKETEIPLECRLFAIADAYDSMTSVRPYRKALSGSEALTELKRQAGIQFDPDLVEQFINIMET